jgi:hypothetical protein
MKKQLKTPLLILSVTGALAIFAGCSSEPTKATDTAATATTNAPMAVVTQTTPIPTSTPAPTVQPTASPVQAAPKARIDFKSAEHIAASKDRLAKDYADSFSTQKMLQAAAIKNQGELEDLVNGLTDDEWSGLKASYTRLVNDYNDSPSTVFMLFKHEVESYRSMK